MVLNLYASVIHQLQEISCQHFRFNQGVAQTVTFSYERIDLEVKRAGISWQHMPLVPRARSRIYGTQTRLRMRPLLIARVRREKIALSRYRRNESPTTARQEHEIRTLVFRGR